MVAKDTLYSSLPISSSSNDYNPDESYMHGDKAVLLRHDNKSHENLLANSSLFADSSIYLRRHFYYGLYKKHGYSFFICLSISILLLTVYIGIIFCVTLYDIRELVSSYHSWQVYLHF